jgi:hypothetical protein|nr:MAG TPA: hypothetical protein [Caudoviricetes sp.]
MTLTQLSVHLGIQGEEFNDVRALIAANHVDMAIAHLQAALNSIDVESYEAKTTLEELLK